MQESARSTITVYEFTHIGHRSENQDRMKVFRSPEKNESLLLVADGLGGHSGGRLAAQTIVRVADHCWESRKQNQNAEDFLEDLVRKCHAAVNRVGKELGLDPRSTLAALLVQGSEITTIHAGDSRVIQFSDARLVKRTLDHSIGQLNVLRGVISEEELATHPDQTKLITQIGGEEIPDAEVEHWNPAEGRDFVLCTDGFWEIFSPDEILAVFASPDPMRDLNARYSAKFARLRRHDNTTAILASIVAPKRPRQHFIIGTTLLSMLASGILLLHPTTENNTDPPRTEQGPILGTSDSEGALTIRQETADLDPRDRLADALKNTEQFFYQPIPVPIHRVELEIGRAVEPGHSVSETVADELRKAGVIGPDDTLEPEREHHQLDGRTIIQLNQKHKDLPVIAAYLFVVCKGSLIVAIYGYTAPTIEIDTSLANDYSTTLGFAGEVIDSRIEPLDNGTLVILRVPGSGYQLCWYGVVRIDQREEQTILNAESGKIHVRLPAGINSWLESVPRRGMP